MICFTGDNFEGELTCFRGDLRTYGWDESPPGPTPANTHFLHGYLYLRLHDVDSSQVVLQEFLDAGGRWMVTGTGGWYLLLELLA